MSNFHFHNFLLGVEFTFSLHVKFGILSTLFSFLGVICYNRINESECYSEKRKIKTDYVFQCR